MIFSKIGHSPLRQKIAVYSAALSFLLTVSDSQAEEDLGITRNRPSEGHFVVIDGGFMVPYQTKIPGTEVVFEMVPVPGGKVKLAHPDRSDQTKPHMIREVTIAPFWIGRHEVTWAEYDQYFNLRRAFMRFRQIGVRKVTPETMIDAVTTPSMFYVPPTPINAKKSELPRHPAVTMTQYAARQYTKWLSRISGHFYRLPAEIEWIHACRAGSQTEFSFGDDPLMLEEYAWYFKNSNEETHPVGLKKPNRWGLFDMHGNAMEWCLDEYSDSYEGLKNAAADSLLPVSWPERMHPRTVCGGSWDSDAKDCRSASRIGSTTDWHSMDPSIPPSPHWMAYTGYRQVGFRIVRQFEPASRQLQSACWDEVSPKVEDQLRSHGHIQSGLVDPSLPDAIRKLPR